MTDIPKQQQAVQLVGPDELVFNDSKEVFEPGPHQILCRVEATGLCFSDLKLLKQFSAHVRKGPIESGLDLGILDEIPSYVPCAKPTVPGHEAVVIVVQVGLEVEDYKIGQRYLVQADYRWLKTATSNGAFGYNFEGALQEYVLMDERVITSPEGDSMLLPASVDHSAAAIALAEPWACVEEAYANKERQTIKNNSKMLIIAETAIDDNALSDLFDNYGKPGNITWLGEGAAADPGVPVTELSDKTELLDAEYDDVVYFGSQAETVEMLFDKVALDGILNIVLCGGKFGCEINAKVGRVHYGGIRVIGTVGSAPADSMKNIPATDEIRTGDKINVIGAGGPMGIMHVIRNICQGVEGVTVFAGDVDDERLAALSKIAVPLAEKNKVTYKTYNAKTNKIAEAFDYIALMAPIPALVSQAIQDTASKGLINIFAGIPATVVGALDLDAYIEKQLYFIGTSGSTLDDLKLVLDKVETDQLDTNVSVAAISGLAGAVEGIRAVENRLIAGKILVYPACKDIPLTKLGELQDKYPNVAKCLNDGLWTKKAEDALLKHHSS
ncbi:alcohol dehydrogenase catalytic domain-containing protein [Planctomycetota bacterium]